MKKNLLIIAVFLVCQSLSGQIDIGIITSYSTASSQTESLLLGTPEGRKAVDIAFLEHRNVATIGVSLRKDFGPLFTEAQVSYRRNAYTLQVRNYLMIDAPMQYVEETFSSINVPVLAGLRFGKLRVSTGPIFNINMNKTSNNLELYNINDNKRELHMGAAASISFDISKNITIGARYERSFNTIGNEYKYAGKELDIDSKLDFVTFTAGYYF